MSNNKWMGSEGAESAEEMENDVSNYQQYQQEKYGNAVKEKESIYDEDHYRQEI